MFSQRHTAFFSKILVVKFAKAMACSASKTWLPGTRDVVPSNTAWFHRDFPHQIIISPIYWLVYVSRCLYILVYVSIY